MDIYKISPHNKYKELLKNLGVQDGGISIISDKMDRHLIYIKNLRTPAGNILKQDALSIGAELAVPSGVITCSSKYTDALLIASTKELKILSKKELAQPFGLKELAIKLKRYVDTNDYSTKIMGVINANDDSFYEKSRFDTTTALSKIEEMIKEGATIIDIGAVSSRPNAPIVDEYIELSRIKALCDVIYEKELYKKAIFSIDSYSFNVVKYALKSGFKIINDITGARDERLIHLAKEYNARYVIMHMKGTPQTMQDSPTYDDVMIEVSNFFETQIQKCIDAGLTLDDIILDIGIGFGKTLKHNITLLNNLEHFKSFGCELLVGASRKSMIEHIMKEPTPTKDRLSGTLALHLKAIENGATIIRCHDVYEHKQAISVALEMMNFNTI
jgi:dihydropteroate synthase